MVTQEAQLSQRCRAILHVIE